MRSSIAAGGCCSLAPAISSSGFRPRGASCGLPAELAKLDRFDLLVLDDISYVRRDQAETSVLFELIAERYERKSLAITANQPFSAWDGIFPDAAMTLAAVDRLVHHATILEMNVESYRRKSGPSGARPGRARRNQTGEIGRFRDSTPRHTGQVN